MKVRIVTTVEIDPRAWLANYGIVPAPGATLRLRDIQADVRRDLEGVIDEHIERINCRALPERPAPPILTVV
jgi:hypothetical protein